MPLASSLTTSPGFTGRVDSPLMRTTGGWLACSKGFTHQSKSGGEVSLERRSPAVHRGHPRVRVSLRVDIVVGDVGQLVALAPEATAPTASPSLRPPGSQWSGLVDEVGDELVRHRAA